MGHVAAARKRGHQWCHVNVIDYLYLSVDIVFQKNKVALLIQVQV